MPEATMAMKKDDPHANAHGMTPGQHRLHMILLGTALAAGAVMLAPYVLPAIGIGSADMAGDIVEAAHGLSGGLAGAVNGAIGLVPLVGSTLAQGGLWTAAAAGITGIGGMLLSRYVSKREDGSSHIRWSRVIRTAALVTSSLIALPAALTSLTIGITFLSAMLAGTSVASGVLNTLATTVGVGGMQGGVSGLTGLLPHLLTCGATLLPASVTLLMGGQKHMQGKHASTMAAMGGHPMMSMEMQPTGDIHAAVTVNQPTQANMPVQGLLHLSHADGAPLTAAELAVTHTQKIHLFVVDQALKDYHHIHPMPTDEPGVFRFSFTPATSNRYSAWVDATTLSDSKDHIAKTEIPSAVHRNIPPSIRVNSKADTGGLEYTWKMQEPLRKGEASIVDITVKDKDGKPVTDLEPVMGAYAHLVGFSSDGSRIIHSHPLGAAPAGPDDRGGPRLRFQVEPDQAGPIQFFLHVQRGGEAVYVPFGQEVKASLSQSVSHRYEQPASAVAYG